MFDDAECCTYLSPEYPQCTTHYNAGRDQYIDNKVTSYDGVSYTTWWLFYHIMIYWLYTQTVES